MSWLSDLFLHSPSAGVSVAHAVVILGLVTFLGLALGSIQVFGIRLGVAGVLFVGLAFGHFGLGLDHTVLEFARDFGLILFVYTIGLQIGPGFGASLRKQGLPLNLMAAGIVLLGVLLTILLGRLALPRAEFPAIVGVFSGATTNTPSLAAAQQALGANAPDAGKLPALGYAVAYPFGVIGIILSMFLIRWVFRVNLEQETRALAEGDGAAPKEMERVNVQVTNESLHGMTLEALMAQAPPSVLVSRVQHDGSTQVAAPSDVIARGDVLLAVGPPKDVRAFAQAVGEESQLDLVATSSPLMFRNVLVTQPGVLGKSIPQLHLAERFHVAMTRIRRGDVELTATPEVKLTFGDRVRIIGEERAIREAAAVLGDSVEARDHPMVIPMFLGIVLGVILGSVPIPLPGFPVPVKLGLAGGPLIAAIILSRIGRIGPLLWYTPRSANLLVREIGIVLFLGCVGLKAGDQFVQTLIHGHGLVWMACGAVITVVPLLTIAAIGRLALKLNYLPLCGLLAGSMTDPPALAFAGAVTRSEVPSVAYAAVYPLVMLLRILAAQAMILFFR
ncbi:MAG: putative transporter [Armatimonadota bacterium]|nr:putative transporter [Armatimonadota bacterium]